jgi:hypothetical protein
MLVRFSFKPVFQKRTGTSFADRELAQWRGLTHSSTEQVRGEFMQNTAPLAVVALSCVLAEQHRRQARPQRQKQLTH